MPPHFFVSLPAPSLSLLPPPSTTISLSLSSLSPPPPPTNRGRTTTVRSSMEDRRRSRVSLFPPLPHRDLMLDVISAVDSRLSPHLLPSSVPSDVLSFRNPTGSSLGSLDIRRGSPASSVDFMLESWLHCRLPTGALDITTLLAFLNGSTDAPHLMMELIQASPTALVLLLDLLPRKDLPLHQHYLDDFYHRTQLDRQRQQLESLPQVRPYRSPSLYVRSIFSPTAVAVAVDCGEGAESVMEDIVRARLGSVAREYVRVWSDECACSTKQMEASETAHMRRRDGLIKAKAIEIDLSANLPRLFGPDVSNRVVAEIQKAFGEQR
ncbi:red chlorophyll catabolite reductase [Ananas comosus]|uniref:Red chlorophyll catabolite reductase n=1 Tax=Ananas comosus TaxID=4615 RepID=A0A6P5GFV3_ANACO|nr:red chlorophyll catabolite reductase [Ananas comosus]